MAVSGNQLTRIGGSTAGVASKLTILAKAAGGVTTTILDFGRGMMRGMMRGFAR